MLEKQIQACQKLGMSEQEIAELAETDKRIDKGERLFELTTEQKQAEKKVKSAGKTVYNFSKPREKKEDNDKRFLIEILENAVKENGGEVVEIANPEREFAFTFNGKKGHEIVLFYSIDIKDKDYQEEYVMDEDSKEDKTIWVDIDSLKRREKIIYPEKIFEYIDKELYKKGFHGINIDNWDTVQVPG